MSVIVSKKGRFSSILLSILAVFVGLSAVAIALNPLFAIRGSYVLIGLVVTAVIYYFTDSPTSSLAVLRRSVVDELSVTSERVSKAVLIVSVLAVTVSTITGDRLFPLLVALSVGYSLLVLQLVREEYRSGRMLGQITVLFAISPLTKYLTSGFYIGNGDLVIHVENVKRLVGAGAIEAISDSYRFFPGFHLLVGSVSLVTGLSAYDAILLVGVVTFSLVGVVMFIFARTVTSHPHLSLHIALASTILLPLTFYSSYFIPGSLGAVLGLFVLFVGFRAGNSATSRKRLVEANIVMIASLVITHHLTFVLYAIVLLVFIISNALADYLGSPDKNQRSPQIPPVTLLVAAVSALVYWTWSGKGFIFALGTAIVSLVGSIANFGIAPGVAASQRAITLGLSISEPTTISTLLWLVTPDGIYYTTLVVFFGLGLLAVTEFPMEVKAFASILVTGIIGGVVMFKTPLVIKGMADLALVWSFLFAFIIGIGMSRVTSVEYRSLLRKVPLLVLILLCVTGPVAAADDLNELRFDLPPQQSPQEHVFSPQEEQVLEATSQYLQAHDAQVSTFWATRLMIARSTDRRNDNSFITEPNVTRTGIHVDEGLFLYRDSWDEHAVISSGVIYQRRLYMSTQWLRTTVATKNKVYSTGDVGLLWASGPRTYAANETAARGR